MKFKLLFILFVFCSITSWSCSDKDTSDDTVLTTPTNLVVTQEIVGQTTTQPTGDGSGVLNLTISATNATAFKISYGDGTVLDAVSGKNTYTYQVSGTFTYTIIVTAFNGAANVSSTLSIRIARGTLPVWADEFNNNGAPDSSKWNYDLGTGSGGWGNNESQNYTNRAENVIVENGVLKIITKKESYQGSNYTSARLKTQGKFSIQYGKIEFRAKLPSGGGTWPALWMLGDNIATIGWPACGEIDVMEHKGNELNKIHGTLHFPGRSGGNPDTTALTPNTTATTEFHIYSVDWRKESIKFYIDNVLFKTFTNSANLPLNQKFFIIMNSAIGGTFGGAIDSNFVSSTFEIDYVRVYN